MLTFDKKIEAFIKKHYAPATVQDASLRLTTSQMLDHISGVYPRNAIDAFELFDILKRLGFEESAYRVEEKNSNGEVTGHTHHVGWLMKVVDEANVLHEAPSPPLGGSE